MRELVLGTGAKARMTLVLWFVLLQLHVQHFFFQLELDTQGPRDSTQPQSMSQHVNFFGTVMSWFGMQSCL